MADRLHQFAPDIDGVHRWVAACLAPTRLEILVDLGRAGESSVGAIAERLELDRSVVSHALSALREADLVRVRADGRRRLYHRGPGFHFETTDDGFWLRIRRDDGYELALTRTTTRF